VRTSIIIESITFTYRIDNIVMVSGFDMEYCVIFL